MHMKCRLHSCFRRGKYEEQISELSHLLQLQSTCELYMHPRWLQKKIDVSGGLLDCLDDKLSRIDIAEG